MFRHIVPVADERVEVGVVGRRLFYCVEIVLSQRLGDVGFNLHVYVPGDFHRSFGRLVLLFDCDVCQAVFEEMAHDKRQISDEVLLLGLQFTQELQVVLVISAHVLKLSLEFLRILTLGLQRFDLLVQLSESLQIIADLLFGLLFQPEHDLTN